MPTRLLLGQLVHHHGCLTDHHLVLVVQQLGQLRNGALCEVSVILEINKIINASDNVDELRKVVPGS